MAASRQTSLSVSVLLMPDLLPGTPEREALEALADLAAEAGTETVYTGRGDRLVFEGRRPVTLEVLSPRRRTAYESANAASLVLAVRDGLCGVLLTGDAEGSGEEELTALLENTAGSFALLKAAHHGSSGSTSAAMLEAVSPGLVLLSNGRAERFEALSGRCREIPLMDTRTCGAIILHIENDGLTVEVMRQAGKDGHGS